MSLALPEHWLWTSGSPQDGPDVHAFFLYAPRVLGDPELRHHSMLVSGRVNHGPSDGRGVIGHAWPPRAAPTTWSPGRSSAVYVLDRDAFLVGDPTSRYYGGRLLHHRGSWHFFAWQHLDDHGRFLGDAQRPDAADHSP